MKLNNTTRTWKAVSYILTAVIFLILFDVNIEPRPLFGGSERPYSANLSVDVVPVGIPAVYGAEIGVSYDDIDPYDPARADEAIDKMAQLDLTLTLQGEDLDRYVDILYHQHGGMSCEYCCGARSIIFENGDPACGCAHSYAMRGLAKYLILEHGDSLSDDQILAEIGKWKVLFFPGIHASKAAVMQGSGIDVDYISLTTNIFRGIEDGASAGEMVGGC